MDSNHTCLAVINLDSALKEGKNYYPQVFLKECKYIKKKVIRNITQDIVMVSGNSDEEKLFLNKRLKKFQKRDEVLLCNIFPFLDYPYTLDYKKVLLTILITSYTAYQSLFAF